MSTSDSVDFDAMKTAILAFVKERDWEQFHNPKDTAISLALEAAEVLEHFQWKNTEEIAEYLQNHKDKLADELVDVLYWVILMSHYQQIDLDEAFTRKMAENRAKYPANEAKGKHDKYTRYQKG